MERDMLTILRRHLQCCPHTSRTYRRCQSPIHVQGSLGGETIRRALDLTAWAAASNVIAQWNAAGAVGVMKDLHGLGFIEEPVIADFNRADVEVVKALN
jgi:hypothetical protein